MFNNDVPSKLWQCNNFSEQKAWCRGQIEAGHTLTDPQIWLGGADPDNIIRALRRSGMKIETCRVKTVDAGGTEHPKTLAWRLATIQMPPLSKDVENTGAANA